MMGRGTARNMQNFKPKLMWEISAPDQFYYKEINYDARSHERKKKIDASFVAGTTWKSSGIAVKFLISFTNFNAQFLY